MPAITIPPTCGSMHSGQRRAVKAMMALSMEKASLGSPAMIQPLILTGSPSTPARENCPEEAVMPP